MLSNYDLDTIVVFKSSIIGLKAMAKIPISSLDFRFTLVFNFPALIFVFAFLTLIINIETVEILFVSSLKDYYESYVYLIRDL